MRFTKQKTYWLCHVSGIALLALSSANAQAVPEGGVVVGGNATIHQQPNYTKIQQHTERAAINWKRFDIPADHHTHFAQPTRNSVALNRVTGSQDPSQIMGKLTADGTVALVNPNGIVFGKGAKVDVGGIIASTADIRTEDFMAGRDHYTIPGKANASIENHGSITVKEAGLAAFVAPNVRNSGTVTAHIGKVEMASAESFAVDLYGDGLYKLAISDNHASRLLEQSGTVDAKGGYVRMSAAQAKELVDSSLKVSGTINVSNNSGKGGAVELSADKIDITNTARIHADGTSGGGKVLVGGDFQGGKNPAIQLAEKKPDNAVFTNIAAGATITANAVQNGKGGTVIVWADDTTHHQGKIEAKGGTQGGNGGFVEVSGKQKLKYAGTTDTSAPKGKNGTLLLDPTDIVIADSGGDITPATIVDNIEDNGEVIIHTNYGTGEDGNITVDSPISYTSSNAFTLLAQGDMRINRSIQNNGSGDLNLVAGWDGTTGYNASWANPLAVGSAFDIQDIINNTSSYGNSLGAATGSMYVNDITNNNSLAVGSFSGTTHVLGNNISVIANSNARSIIGYAVGGNASGSINVTAKNNLHIAGHSTSDRLAQIGHGGQSVAGNFSGDINVRANNITLTGGNASPYDSSARIGHGGDNNGTYNYSGNIDVRATNNITLTSGSNENLTQIGHGGTGSPMSGARSGNITVHANDIILNGGTDNSAPALIGHGGSYYFQDYNLQGNIEIRARNLTLNGRNGSISSPARIGHAVTNNATQNNPVSGNIDIELTGNAILAATNGAHAAIGHGHTRPGTGITVSGDVRVQADGNVSLSGGANDNGYVKIGHGGNGSTTTGAYSGNVIVTSGGNISLQSGAGTNSFAQIGHGGSLGIGSDMSGNISVTSDGTIALQAGTGDESYVQIGHGGDGFNNSLSGALSGDITVNADGNISITGGDHGSGDEKAAFIGHGGDGASGTASGNINVTSGANISLIGGRDDESNAQIGHSGLNAANFDGSGNITVTTTGNLLAEGGNDRAESFAMIGHGADQNTGNHSGNITVDVGGALTLRGTRTENLAQIGHGGNRADGALDGNIAVNANGISIIGGNQFQTTAKIGHGGGEDNTGDQSGNILIYNNGILSLQGGSSNESYAQIGHGSDGVNGNLSGNITISGNNIITLQGGSATDSYSGIGHGGDNATGNQNGDITINAQGISMLAGSSGRTSAKIGHGGPEDTSGNLSGNITVTNTGNLVMRGGSATESHAQIGHGSDANNGSSGNYNGDISLTGNTTLDLQSGNADDTYIMIGHGGENANGNHNGNINIDVDDNIFMRASTGSDDQFVLIGHGGLNNDNNQTTGTRGGHIFLRSNSEISMRRDGTNPIHIGHYTLNASGTDITNANTFISSQYINFDGIAGTSYILNNNNFRDNMIANLIGGHVSIASTAAPLMIDTPFTATTANRLNFLSSSDITINENISLISGGKLAAFAGWNGNSGLDITNAQLNLATVALANNNNGSLIIDAALEADGTDVNMILASDDELTVASGGSLNSNAGFYHFFVQDGPRTDIAATVIDEEIELTPYSQAISNANNSKQMVFYRLSKTPPSPPSSSSNNQTPVTTAPPPAILPQPVTALPDISQPTPTPEPMPQPEQLPIIQLVQQQVTPRASLWENIFTSFETPPQANNPFISLGSIEPSLETQLLSYEIEYDIPNRHPKKSLARRIMELPQHLWSREYSAKIFKQ